MIARAAVLPVPVRRVAQVLLSLLAAALVMVASRPSARAAESHTIIVPAEDGYGFGDCLKGGMSCGRIVADAWCEANGLAAATAYGRAEDVTGTTPGAAAAKVEAGAFVVTCAD